MAGQPYNPLQFKELLTDGSPMAPKGNITYNTSTQRYQIIMPSGAYLEIVDHYEDVYLDVYLYPAPEDRATGGEGLCGNYNDVYDPPDTLHGATSCPKWKVPPADSFFGGNAKCQNYTLPKSRVCGCSSQDTASCTEANAVETTDKLQFACSTSKRSVDTYSDDIVSDDDMFYTLPYEQSPPLRDPLWPTPGGITESQAQTLCQQVIESSSAYDQCSSYPLSGVKDVCVLDVAVSDSLNFMNGTATVFETECLIAARANITLTSADPVVVAQQLESVTSISSKICPRQCSGHGTCGGGLCSCHTGYFGPDCSLVVGEAPQILALRSPVCDRRTRPCQKIRVYALGFDERTVSCRYLSVDSGTIFSGVALVASSMEVVCFLPDSPVWPSSTSTGAETYHNYQISLSSDGVIYSNQALLTVYDSLCMECDNEGDCGVKADACAIDGTCYLAGEFESDSCFDCQPEVDMDSWTRNTKKCPDPYDPETGLGTGAIAGIAIGSAVVAVLVTVGVCYVMKKAKLKKRKQQENSGSKLFNNIIYPGSPRSTVEDSPPDYEEIGIGNKPVIDEITNAAPPMSTGYTGIEYSEVA